jgi:hypothetical protein
MTFFTYGFHMTYVQSWENKYEIKPGRWVYVPTEVAKNYGRGVISRLGAKWNAPSYYYHLKKGGHVKALECHLKSTFFASLDLKDFFGSISRTRVTRSLKDFFCYADAREIAKASTVPHSRRTEHSHSLPYGFCQSPILASICLDKSTLGLCLRKLDEDDDIVISIYMDDIVCSSFNAEKVDASIIEIKEAAIKSHLDFNENKEHQTSAHISVFNIDVVSQSMSVTGDRFEKFLAVYNDRNSSIHQRKGIGGYIWTVNSSQAPWLDFSS